MRKWRKAVCEFFHPCGSHELHPFLQRVLSVSRGFVFESVFCFPFLHPFPFKPVEPACPGLTPCVCVCNFAGTACFLYMGMWLCLWRLKLPRWLLSFLEPFIQCQTETLGRELRGRNLWGGGKESMPIIRKEERGLVWVHFSGRRRHTLNCK